MELLREILLELTDAESNYLDQAVSAMFKKFGLVFEQSNHFKNRVLNKGEKGRRENERNSLARDTDVSANEILLTFKRFLDRHGKTILDARKTKDEYIGIIRNLSNDINIVFKIDYQYAKKRHNTFRIITLKKRKNFVPKMETDNVFNVRTIAR